MEPEIVNAWIAVLVMILIYVIIIGKNRPK